MSDTDNGKHELCREVGRRGAVIMQQEQIIAVLEAEVAAWRNADTWHDLIGYMKEDTDHSHASEVEEAMAQTDAMEPTT